MFSDFNTEEHFRTNMALYPKGEKLDEFDGRFALVNLAARRATQIVEDNTRVFVKTDSIHPLTIALEEIAEGAIIPVYEEPSTAAVPIEKQDAAELAIREPDQIDQMISDILGPALDTDLRADTEPSLNELADMSELSEGMMPGIGSEEENLELEGFSITDLAGEGPGDFQMTEETPEEEV